MSKREIAVGVVIILLLSGYVFYKQRQSVSTPELSVPQILSIEDKIEDKFNITIPENLNRAELKDISGGFSSGIATIDDQRSYQEVTVLADLPNPPQDSFYQGWLYNTDNTPISMGKLLEGKGGWILDYRSTKSILDYKRVAVSLESTIDESLGKKVLEGFFK